MLPYRIIRCKTHLKFVESLLTGNVWRYGLILMLKSIPRTLQTDIFVYRVLYRYFRV